MRYRRIALFLLLFAFLAGLVAWARHPDAPQVPKAPPQDAIAAQWARAMASYNILPVYPPSEDVHVGDIFGYVADVDGVVGNLFSSVKIDTVSVSKELREVYRLHPVFPATMTAPPRDGSAWRQPSAVVRTGKTASPANIYAPPESNFELPLMALPEFELAVTDSGSLNGNLPLQFLRMAFGAAYRDEGTVSIKINAAETYGLPTRVARDIFQNWCDSKIAFTTCTEGNVRAELRALRHLDSKTPVGLAFVTRVYLARSIEYRYHTASAKGVQADTLRPQPAAPDKKTEPVQSEQEGKANETATQLKELKATLNTLQQTLGEFNQKMQSSAVTGVSFSVGQANAQGVTLIQTFERPVAIGYRPITLNPPK